MKFHVEYCLRHLECFLEFYIPKQIAYFQLKVYISFLINIIGYEVNENYLI